MTKKDKTLTLDVGSDGVIRTIYSDDLKPLAEKIGGEISTVCRASNVEWETTDKPANNYPLTKGWAVRSNHDPELALRWKRTGTGLPVYEVICSRDPELAIALFETREAAIAHEVHYFFELLPPRNSEKKEQ